MVYEEIISWDICSCLSTSRGASSEWSNGQKKEMVRRPTRLLAKRHDFWIFFLCKILLHATPWCHVDRGIFNLDKAHISDGLMAIGCKEGARLERGKEALFHETTFYSSLRKNSDMMKNRVVSFEMCPKQKGISVDVERRFWHPMLSYK